MRLLVLALSASLAACGGTGSSCTSAEDTLVVLNAARAQGAWCGPPAAPVSLDPRLQAAAQGFADDLAAHAIPAGHIGSDGSTVADRLTRVGYPGVVGENSAMGTDGASATVRAFVGSADHCANVMRPQAPHAGLACAEADGRAYWVQLTGWLP